MNLMLYLATVLIWGSTWIAIAWQLGPIPIEVSVLYRFALAALALLPCSPPAAVSPRLPWAGQRYAALLGGLLFPPTSLLLPRHPLHSERPVGGDLRQCQHLQRPQPLAVRG